MSGEGSPGEYIHASDRDRDLSNNTDRADLRHGTHAYTMYILQIIMRESVQITQIVQDQRKNMLLYNTRAHATITRPNRVDQHQINTTATKTYRLLISCTLAR